MPTLVAREGHALRVLHDKLSVSQYFTAPVFRLTPLYNCLCVSSLYILRVLHSVGPKLS